MLLLAGWVVRGFFVSRLARLRQVDEQNLAVPITFSRAVNVLPHTEQVTGPIARHFTGFIF